MELAQVSSTLLHYTEGCEANIVGVKIGWTSKVYICLASCDDVSPDVDSPIVKYMQSVPQHLFALM